MKVIHCLDTLNVGGAEKVGVDACNLLAETAEYSVALLLIRCGGPLRRTLSHKVTVKELGFYDKTSISGWINLIRSLRGYDIIHVHMRHTYGRVKLATMLAGIRTPIIFHDHFGDIEFDKKIPGYLSNAFRPTYYLGVSRDLTKWAIDSLGVEGANSWTLPNTIASEVHFQPVEQRSKCLVMVSNIRPTKNIEFAINIAKKSGLKLDIYGQIIDRDYYEELVILANGYPIKFITDVSNVFPFLSRYKLAVHTAKSETGPLVVMEYLKSGTSFLAFSTGEVIRQIKEDLPQSIMYDFDESKWLKAIDLLIGNPIPENHLKAFFDNRFGPKAYIENLKGIYQCVGRS